MKTGRRCRPGRAFTLLELLLVNLIIGILAALFLPVLSMASGRGKRVQCANNLKQIGLAILAFAHEHDDKSPFQVSLQADGSIGSDPRSATGEFSSGYPALQVLSNDLDTPKILICPADPWHTVAASFATLRPTNVSYFFCNLAKPYNSEAWLACEGLDSASLAFSSESGLGKYSGRPLRHDGTENLPLADGHLQLVRGNTIRFGSA